MYQQPDLFTGQDLASKGLQIAVDNANNNIDNWSSKAINAAFKYVDILPKDHVFQVEDIREWALQENLVDLPPSNRAWGCVVRPLLTSQKVVKNGIMPVSNKKAHGANANSYKRI